MRRASVWYEDLHSLSSNHRPELVKAGTGGCFYCESTFRTDEIREWIDKEQTALCPRCGIDSVLPFYISHDPDLFAEDLALMHDYWFERYEPMKKPDLGIRQLQKESYENSSAKGFWDDQDNRNIPSKLALIHSEISEALEEYRKNRVETYYSEGGKPEGFGVELADAVIRIADLAEHLGLDLADLIQEKAAYNVTRPFKHGNKKI